MKCNERISLAALIIIAAIIKFAVVIILEMEPYSDAIAYMKIATSMIDTGLINDGAGNVAFYSSGYSLFLIPFFILFGDSPETAQFANALVGTLSVPLVFYCSKKILKDWKWAIVPSILWITYPPNILYTEYVLKENLMVPLILSQVLLLLYYKQSSRPRLIALALGIVFGLELLVGPAVILTVTIIIIVLCAANNKKPFILYFGWDKIILFAIACGIVLSPWLFYTNSKLGQPVLNTNGNFNLYLGNNPNATVMFSGIQNTPLGSEWHSLRENLGEVKATSYLKDKAIVYMIDNPTKTLWITLKKMVYFWMPPLHEGKGGNQSKAEEIVRFIWLGYYLIIIVLALFPLFFPKEFKQIHLILYGHVFLYCAIHGTTYIIFRYREPIMPILCILAGLGFGVIFKKIFGHKEFNKRYS